MSPFLLVRRAPQLKAQFLAIYRAYVQEDLSAVGTRTATGAEDPQVGALGAPGKTAQWHLLAHIQALQPPCLDPQVGAFGAPGRVVEC